VGAYQFQCWETYRCVDCFAPEKIPDFKEINIKGGGTLGDTSLVRHEKAGLIG